MFKTVHSILCETLYDIIKPFTIFGPNHTETIWKLTHFHIFTIYIVMTYGI